ncbi:MAG: zf-HC2 domain-containing protein [Deltaproteobacteria bacterium]|nr:zf-HC2 domain-containing protein [Deltaproteobacteria bacterium]
MTQGATTTTNFDCSDVARLLEPYLDSEFGADDRASIEAHLSACAPCRDGAAAAMAFRSALRARLRAAFAPGSPQATAPDSLRRRISAALDAEEARPAAWWRRLFSPLPVAAVAACVAGALVVFAGHRATDPLVEEAVRKHARDLPLELNTASIAPELIPSMLASKLDFNPKPPAFRADGVKLVGARLAQIRNWPAAYMRYETPRGPLGLFIIDDPQRRVAEEGHQVRAGPATVWVMNMRGYHVAVWRRDEIVYSLVSDLDEADLVRLVETAQSADR